MITQAICHILLYYEEFQQIEDAIAREKELKGWSRSKKDTSNNLIDTIFKQRRK